MTYLQKKKLSFMSIINNVKGFVRKISGVSPLTLPDCVDEDSLIDYTISGNCVQDGTPTPDTPVEIKSVGDKTANLFNHDKWWELAGTDFLPSYGGFTSTKIDNGYKLNKNCSIGWTLTNLEAGATYTVSAKATTSRSGTNIIGVVVNGSVVDYNYYYSKGSTTITTTFTATKSTRFGFCHTNLSYDGAYLELTDIMLVKGKTSKEYEPYDKYKIPVTARNEDGQEIITNIYLDAPLRRLTNYINVEYCDKLNLETGKIIRKVREVINPNDYTKYSHSGDICAFYTRSTQYSTMYGHIQSAPKCNICKWNTNPSAAVTEKNPLWMYLAHDTSAGHYMVVFWVHISLIGVSSSDTDAVKLQAFKEWMAKRKVVVICPCNPYSEDVELPNIPTFKGTTIYTIGATTQPSNMSATYYATSKE